MEVRATGGKLPDGAPHRWEGRNAFLVRWNTPGSGVIAAIIWPTQGRLYERNPADRSSFAHGIILQREDRSA